MLLLVVEVRVYYYLNIDFESGGFLGIFSFFCGGEVFMVGEWFKLFFGFDMFDLDSVDMEGLVNNSIVFNRKIVKKVGLYVWVFF